MMNYDRIRCELSHHGEWQDIVRLRMRSMERRPDYYKLPKILLVNLIFRSLHLLGRALGNFFINIHNVIAFPGLSLHKILTFLDLPCFTEVCPSTMLTLRWSVFLYERDSQRFAFDISYFQVSVGNQFSVLQRRKIIKGLLLYCPAVRRLMEVKNRED